MSFFEKIHIITLLQILKMKFEKFLQKPNTNPQQPENPYPSSVFWYFDSHTPLLHNHLGPILVYKSFSDFQSQKKLYEFLDSDLAIHGRHIVVKHHTNQTTQTFSFKVQWCERLVLAEEELYFWPYGGYYKPGCLAHEIEQIFFTIRYENEKVVPFFLRERDLAHYPSASIIS
jgi:hypothetical protein